MNLNQLKLFHMTVKHGSISGAAKALHLSQPAVSKAISRLQDHYGIRLLEKEGRRLLPTPLGRQLNHKAMQIFELAAEAEEIIRIHKGGPARQVVIHASETFGSYYLPEAVNKAERHHPDVRVCLDLFRDVQVLEQTLGMENDLGVVSHPPNHPDLVLLTVIDDPLVIIVPPGHRLWGKAHLSPPDLVGERFIMHEPGSAPHAMALCLFDEMRVRPAIPLTLSTNTAIKQGVRDGLGLALISRVSVEAEVSSGLLFAIPLIHSPMVRQFYIIRNRGKALSEQAARLVRAFTP